MARYQAGRRTTLEMLHLGHLAVGQLIRSILIDHLQ